MAPYKFTFGEVLTNALQSIEARNAQLRMHAEEEAFKQRQLDQAKYLGEQELGIQRTTAERMVEEEKKQTKHAEDTSRAAQAALDIQRNEWMASNPLGSIAKPFIRMAMKASGVPETDPTYQDLSRSLETIKDTDRISGQSIYWMSGVLERMGNMNKYQTDEALRSTMVADYNKVATAHQNIWNITPTFKKTINMPETQFTTKGMGIKTVPAHSVSTEMSHTSEAIGDQIIYNTKDFVTILKQSPIGPYNERNPHIEEAINDLSYLLQIDQQRELNPSALEAVLRKFGLPLSTNFKFTEKQKTIVSRLLSQLSGFVGSSKQGQQQDLEAMKAALREETALNIHEGKQTINEKF